MSARTQLAVGLDLGTGGARAVAMSLDGRLVASGTGPIPKKGTRVDGPIVEQQPEAWTGAATAALRELCSQLPGSSEIIGVSADATSGTFLLVGHQGRPLTPGIMYSDLRAADLAEEADDAVREHLAPFGIHIAAAFALPKIVATIRQQPELIERTKHVVHQTDWLIAMLCGRYGVTDISTALKTGADPGRLAWPEALTNPLGIPASWLPEIVLPGTVVGRVTGAAARTTGLPAGTPVVAGCTDGTAGCLASGARQPGDLNVTLGTTLVFKTVTEQPLLDPEGVIYNHRHPAGGYLPGAASSTGGDWIEHFLPGQNLQALTGRAAPLLPTGHIVYPLVKHGERFPFARPAAAGFGLEAISSPPERFAAGMEGVALLERLGVEKLQRLGAVIGPTIYATGGGTSNELWLRIRASVCQRTMAVPRIAECAVGAAALAATPLAGGCTNAIQAIVRAGREVEPVPKWIGAYDERFERFCEILHAKEYL